MEFNRSSNLGNGHDLAQRIDSCSRPARGGLKGRLARNLESNTWKLDTIHRKWMKWEQYHFLASADSCHQCFKWRLRGLGGGDEVVCRCGVSQLSRGTPQNRKLGSTNCHWSAVKPYIWWLQNLSHPWSFRAPQWLTLPIHLSRNLWARLGTVGYPIKRLLKGRVDEILDPWMKSSLYVYNTKSETAYVTLQRTWGDFSS